MIIQFAFPRWRGIALERRKLIQQNATCWLQEVCGDRTLDVLMQLLGAYIGCKLLGEAKRLALEQMTDQQLRQECANSTYCLTNYRRWNEPNKPIRDIQYQDSSWGLSWRAQATNDFVQGMRRAYETAAAKISTSLRAAAKKTADQQSSVPPGIQEYRCVHYKDGYRGTYDAVLLHEKTCGANPAHNRSGMSIAEISLSSFNGFLESEMIRVKNEHPNLAHNDVLKLVGQRWACHPDNPKRIVTLG